MRAEGLASSFVHMQMAARVPLSLESPIVDFRADQSLEDENINQTAGQGRGSRLDNHI